jgi:hypothetical protein
VVLKKTCDHKDIKDYLKGMEEENLGTAHESKEVRKWY